MKLTFVISSAFAAVYDIAARANNFDVTALNIRQTDTIVFKSLEGRHTIIRVGAGNECASVDSKFKSSELKEGDRFIVTFDEPGTFYIADSGKCGSGYRTVINVEALPQNKNKVDMLLVAQSFKDHYGGAISTALGVAALLPFLMVL
jgi:plastocyanin